MGEIQKSAAKCALSWALLTALLCGLYYYANHVVTVELEAPQIQAQTLEDGAVSLTWNAVDYATSYRIYQRPVNGDWSLVKAVPSITLWKRNLTARRNTACAPATRRGDGRH